MTRLVHLDVARGVATLTLDSPDNRNALSTAVRTQLASAVDRALADAAVRVLVLTHTGPVFCAGADLKEARGAGSGEQGVHDLPALFARLWTSPKPVVARLAGPARAGGVGLVAACDLAVAADTVSFAFTEVRLGVVPALISAVVLPRLQPRAATELFLTGQVFSAARAVEVGLLTRAVPADVLDLEVAALVDDLALGGPDALAATKALLSPPLGDRLTALAALSAQHFASAEGQEGIAALLERRPPRWVPVP